MTARGDDVGRLPDDEAAPPLELEDLHCGYGEIVVVRGVDLQLGRGEMLGITGPNGAGKTTLLNTVLGLLPEASGMIRFNGTDIRSLPAHERVRQGLALVPEGRRMIGGLSVLDNLELARQGRGEESDATAFSTALEDVFELFPRLRDRTGQLAGTLSGGEQQMLAIARALLTGPRILLLDEPSQGLAPVIVREVVEALTTLRSRTTMLVVEQNRAVLDGLATRIGVMTAGRLRLTD